LTFAFIARGKKAIFQRWIHAKSNQRWRRLSSDVTLTTAVDTTAAPVILFNASTRLQAMSQNAAYSYLVHQALRLQSVPVIQLVCKAGMSRCVLGSDRDHVEKEPPCDRCVAQSNAVFGDLSTRWFDFQPDTELSRQVDGMTVQEQCSLVYKDTPLGFWTVNSLRWVLRRHHLADDTATRQFMRHFILSAWNIVTQFEKLVTEVHPQAVVVFNGMFFPEAAVRYVSQKHDVRVITHEVGMRPFTAFFTDGEATAYPIHISPEFQLTDDMNGRLDDYLSQRFQGNFSMAGVRFWPEIKGLSPEFLEKAAHFKQIVPIFANVIFDTSQVHANTLFENMFVWLDNVLDTIKIHPQTLFVIRAHPDEHREGKESRESVRAWASEREVETLNNVVFVDSGEYISSYELIQRAHFVMVYNSTIGLEAAIMGKAVLAGGKARFTQLRTAYLPESLTAYNHQLKNLLSAETITVPDDFKTNARRFLYYQLYRSSLPFDTFLKEDGIWKGYVTLKDFPLKDLTPDRSITVKTILEGILHNKPFEMPL
jgi:hypothetical protein